jgi:hypothetical protein
MQRTPSDKLGATKLIKKTKKNVLSSTMSAGFVFDVIVYHLPCADGFVACTIARNLNHNDSAWLVPYVHAKADNRPPLDSFRDQRVLFLDVCWSREEIETIHKLAARLLVLDHHKTAAKVLVFGDDPVYVKKLVHRFSTRRS